MRASTMEDVLTYTCAVPCICLNIHAYIKTCTMHYIKSCKHKKSHQESFFAKCMLLEINYNLLYLERHEIILNQIKHVFNMSQRKQKF